MANTLLRSGDIKDFQALGMDGKAVYLFATQIRETFRIKLGQQYANYLAIPKRNDQGNLVDWYIPFPSTKPNGDYDIVPWSAANEDERKAALVQLHEFEAKVIELGKKMASNPNLSGDQLLFSRLVYNPQASSNYDERENIIAIRFPASDFVYIVNGIPIITFWGFLNAQQQIKGSPFYCLEPIKPSTTVAPKVVPPVEPVVNSVVRKPWWLRWWWWLLAFLLLFLLLFLLRGCYNVGNIPLPFLNTDIPENETENEKIPNIVTTPNGVINNQVVGGGINSQLANPITGEQSDSATNEQLNPDVPVLPDPNSNDQNGVDNNTPEQQDNPGTDNSGMDNPEVDNPGVDNTKPNDNNIPEPENNTTNAPNNTNTPLTLSPETVQNGSTQFLNGKWNVGGGIQDKTTGKPLRLQYDFNKGDGTVTVTRSDGVKCTGNVGSAIAQGNLAINSIKQATCSDNSLYELPKIQCAPGQNNVANCQGYYDNGQKFPITIKQQSDK